MLPRIAAFLRQHQIPHTYRDLAPRQFPPPVTEGLGDFRAGQRKALETIWNSEFGQIWAPTAFGKTELTIKLVKSYPTLKILVVTPFAETVRQLRKRFADHGVDAGIVDGQHHKVQRVTICSAMSLMKVAGPDWDLVLYDEVHKSAAPSSRQALAACTRAKLFGLTASGEGRADNAEIVVEALFGPVICQVEYEEAVKAGNILPIVVLMLDTTGHDTDVKDPGAKSRHLVWRNSQRNAIISQAADMVSKLGQTLVITTVLEHALRLRRRLPGWPVVYGTAPKAHMRDDMTAAEFRAASRAKLLREFMDKLGVPVLNDKDKGELSDKFCSGEIRAAISTMTWSTGVDFPQLQFVIRADAATSEIASTQVPGRGGRLHDTKKCGILIDTEDEFDRTLDNRKKSRIRVYREKRWTILRHIRLEELTRICEGLISHGPSFATDWMLQTARTRSHGSATLPLASQ